MGYPGPIKAAVAGCAASVVRLRRIVSRHPKSRSPALGDLPAHPVHLPLSLIYPVGLIVIVIAASATRPGEAHLHYHNQEVNGVDDESDYRNCVGHDDGSRSVVCVWKEVGCLAHDSVMARLVWNIRISSIDKDTAQI